VRTADDLDRRGLLDPPVPAAGWPLPRVPADPAGLDALVTRYSLGGAAGRLVEALAG